jgi:hypothetical protein
MKVGFVRLSVSKVRRRNNTSNLSCVLVSDPSDNLVMLHSPYFCCYLQGFRQPRAGEGSVTCALTLAHLVLTRTLLISRHYFRDHKYQVDFVTSVVVLNTFSDALF